MSVTTFDSFYKASYSRLVGSLRLVCGDLGLAEEIAQEAFIKAFKKWPQIVAMESPEGWLYKVAYNLVRKSWKLKAKRLVVSISDKDENDFVDSFSKDIDPAIYELYGSIKKLPVKQRSAIILKYTMGYTSEEAAQILDMSPGAFRVMLHRTVNSLKRDHELVEEMEIA